MKEFCNSLLADLEKQISELKLQDYDEIEFAEKAIKISVLTLEKLKTHFLKYKFADTAEEIIFFKSLKPKFVSRLIYYNSIYNILTNKPTGSTKECRKYFESELEKLKVFFNHNLDFYHYHRTSNSLLDKKYFVRGKHDIRLTLDSFYFQADHRFSTSHDYKVAQIIANDLLQFFLESELQKLENKLLIGASENNTNVLKWTASKVSLTELVYALHTEGVFNNGASDLKDIASFFETAFAINLGQYNRTFIEIRARKPERTKFLSALKEKLLKRMDDTDA